MYSQKGLIKQQQKIVLPVDTDFLVNTDSREMFIVLGQHQKMHQTVTNLM